MVILSIVLFPLSLLGYYSVYRFWFDTEEEFFPIIYISAIAVVTYLFGLIGFLRAGALAAEVTGLILLTYILLNKKGKLTLQKLLRSFINPTSLVMLIGIVWAYVITRNVGLSNPDDYSHWYRICRAMWVDNTYPMTPDIEFATYPPGTATWVYYFTCIFGFSIPNCFWAQSILNLSGCCTLFHVLSKVSNNKEKVIKTVLISVASVFLCSLDLSTYTLEVDASVGLVTLAAAIYMLNADFSRRNVVATAVILLSFLDTIKVSGLVFELLLLLLLWFFKVRKLRCTVKGVLTGFIISVVPVVVTLLYRIRNSHYYPDIASSTHAISLARYMNVFASRTNEDIRLYSKNFIMTLNPMNALPQTIVLYVCLLAFIILAIIKADSRKLFLKIVLYITCSWLIYWAVLYLTYLFSMSLWEALRLNCLYRYVGSLAIYLSGLTLYYIIRSINGYGKYFYPKALALVTLLVVLGQVLFGYGYLFEGKQELYPELDYVTDTPWKALKSCAEEGMVYSDDSYYVIWDEQNLPGRLERLIPDRLSTTYFRSENVEVVICDGVEDAERLEALAQGLYDHIVIVGKTSRND